MRTPRKIAITTISVFSLAAAALAGAAIAGGGENVIEARRGADPHVKAIAPNTQIALFADGTEKIRQKGIQGPVENPATGVYCINPKPRMKIGRSVPIVTGEWGESSSSTPTAIWNQERSTCPAGTFEVRTFEDGVATDNVGFVFIVP